MSKEVQQAAGQIDMFMYDEQPEELEYTLSVSVAERAIALDIALKALAQVNMYDGLSHASEQEPHRQEIVKRYGESGTPHLVSATERKADDLERTAKAQFARGFGYWAIEKEDVMHQDELSVFTRVEYGYFRNSLVGGSVQAKKRAKFQKVLDIHKQIVPVPLKRKI
jgi:hypothetical protein